MKISSIIVIGALLGSIANVEAIAVQQRSTMKDFNGADEDEIMDKVFSKYSIEGTDHNGVKNGQKILMKATAPKAAGVILEATHKLKGSQVPGYMKANFEKAWNKFDINNDGFVKAEETHTFMRSLMGKLNKFALAPGSLSDISGGGDSMQAPTPKPEPVKRAPPPAPKKQALAEETLDAEEMQALEAAAEAEVQAGTEANLVDIENE
jgi:hypothetical protein